MMNLKKALVIATALTAVGATAAFASDNLSKSAPQDCGPQQRNCAAKMHRGNKGHFMKAGPYVLMTQEERAAMQQRRETWKKMTPEQREAAYQKYIKERIENASPEEKAKLQKMEDHRQQWLKMTPEQRKEAREKMHQQREKERQERLNQLTPKQRKEVEQFIKDDQAHRKAMRERMEKMTPEQKACLRDARMGRGQHKMGPRAGFPGHGPQMNHRHQAAEQK